MTDGTHSDEWTSIFDRLLGQQGQTFTSDPGEPTTSPPAAPPSEPESELPVPNSVIGTPDADTRVWQGQQALQDDCAVKAQQFILDQFGVHDPAGQLITEADLVRQAESDGWYRPGHGTPNPDIGNLLQANGVDVTKYEHANVYELTAELAQGHKVIIGVDSGELWNGKPDGKGHAIVVSGIDTSDPNNVRVVVSDPGTGESEHRYPLEHFVTAWQSSDFLMVATNEPPPQEQHLPEMANFDYHAGHIHEVAGMPFESFQHFASDPGQFARVLPLLEQPGEPTLTPQSIFHEANPSAYPSAAAAQGAETDPLAEIIQNVEQDASNLEHVFHLIPDQPGHSTTEHARTDMAWSARESTNPMLQSDQATSSAADLSGSSGELHEDPSWGFDQGAEPGNHRDW